MQNPMRLGISQDVAVGAASAACTNAFGLTTIVRVVATIACYVAFGATPTAAKPGGARIAPNWPEYFLVRPGEKIAVITDATGTTGTLTVTEMTR